MAQKVVKLEDTYPGNSHKEREARAAEEVKAVVTQVVSGPVKKRKKSIFERTKHQLGGDDLDSIGRYILYDILIPAFKDTLFSVIKEGASRALFGDSESSRAYREKDRSYVSYSRYYDDRRPQQRRLDSGRIETRPLSSSYYRYDPEDLIFGMRDEAEAVLDGCIDLLDKYGSVSLSDMYALCGIQSNYTDQNWGWDNLSRASVVRTRDGYELRMPKPIYLN